MSNVAKQIQTITCNRLYNTLPAYISTFLHGSGEMQMLLLGNAKVRVESVEGTALNSFQQQNMKNGIKTIQMKTNTSNK